MNRFLAVLLFIMLSGCLESPSGEVEEGPGPTTEGRAVSDPPAQPPLDPDAGVPLAGLDVGLEGIGCTLFSGRTVGSTEPAQRRAGDRFSVAGYGGVSVYYVLTHQCRSTVLGDSVLGEDVWITQVFVQGRPDSETNASYVGFLLEAFTNWEPLADAWSEEIDDAHLASYERIDTDSVSGYTLEAKDIRYSFTPLVGNNGYQTSIGTLEYHLYGGDGTAVFAYTIVGPEDDALQHSALMEVQGGFLSEFSPPAYGFLISNGRGSMELKNINDSKEIE